MITEDYVSFETAKLLKEKGFKEWCRCCYGVAVLHNGENISFDEECDLKDEGMENEIEYVEGGALYYFNCSNSDEDGKVWAAPTLWAAMKWLREKHNIHIELNPICTGDSNEDLEWHYGWAVKTTIFTDRWKRHEAEHIPYEKACEAAIKYCLENLI